MDYIQRAREVLDIEAEGIRHVRNLLDHGFVGVVDKVLGRINQDGKIVITGMGKSLHIGSKIAATLTSTGTPAVVLHPSEAMHGDVGILGRNDVLLALSYSGSTEEIVHLAPIARRHGAMVIAVTGVTDSPLARESDGVIPITVTREACPFNMAPTASTAAMLAIGDALAMVLLEARGFSQEDYAKLHPGGAIGRALLLRVRDVMRTGNRLATVNAGAAVKDAILAMTSCRSGAVAILDDRRHLLGIFTDGDLRRHVAETLRVAEMRIEDVMTPDPVTVNADDLAIDILNVFSAHNINDLIVLDDDALVVGHIDIQDLPKLKIL